MKFIKFIKFIKFLIVSAITLLASNATAENLYRPGTQGYALASYAEKVLPDSISPYFVMMKDPEYFPAQFSSTVNSVLSKNSQKILAAKKWVAPTRTVAFTTYGKSIPETVGRKVCIIVFVDPGRAKIGSTLMHELMHCRIGGAELSALYRQQIVRSASTEPNIPGGAQLSMFEEVLARALSLTYMVNYGIKEDGDFFMTRLKKPYPVNPGPKSVPRAMALCIDKGSCTIDVGQLAKKLLDDNEFVSDLRNDMIEGHAYDVRTGYF